MSTLSYADFWESLLPAYPISKGSMRLPIVTTLLNLPQFDYLKIQKELKSILQDLLDTAGTKDGAISRALSAGEEHIIPLIDSEYTGVIRFDCIWDRQTNDIKILEINCDYPDGLVLHDATYSALCDTNCALHQNLLQELFEPEESIHILHSEKAYFLDGYYTEYNLLKNTKRNVTIGYDVNKITSGYTIRRCLETTKISLETAQSLTKLSSRFINSLALRTLGYKDLLADIKHPYIPKTFRVTNDTSTNCLTYQEQLVLKPADGCEGFGIYFGRDFSTPEWKNLLVSLLSQNYVAQELIEIPKISISLYDNETIVTKELYFDLCPHFFIKNGQVIGSGHTLMRFSENKIVNVSQGGGIGYYKL